MSNTFVSVLVATKNRPQFAENILRNFFRQSYPQDMMELIIGDDGECKMEKLIPEIKNIKYFKFKNISLGEKRNKLCQIARGNIIVFMDDDDFYPIEKVSECVKVLNKSNYEITGSSIMYVFYTKHNVIYNYKM